MKPCYLGLLILALCLLDCFATHREWLTFPGMEGNPVMAWVIAAWGWGAVWCLKAGVGTIVLMFAGPLYRSIVGRCLLWLALAVYTAICGVHLLIVIAS